MSELRQAQLPDGWVAEKLGVVFKTVTGSTPSKSNKAYYGDYMPFMKPPELNDNIISIAADNLSEEGAKAGRVLPKDSILVSCIGNLGKVGRCSKEVAFNQQINAIKPNDSTLPEFMFFQSLSPHFQEQLASLASGTTVPIVNKSKFNSIFIVIPPLEEQKQIVAVLDKAFAAIDQAKANIEKNLQNAKELFQSKLNEIFTQKGEDWEEKKLKEIGVTQTGSTPPTKDKSNYGEFIPFVKPAHFQDDGSIITGDSMLSEKGLKLARRFKEGSILMVCIGATIGKTGYSPVEVTSNQQINALTPAGNYESKFFYYALLTKIFYNRVIHASSQATLPIINKSKWEGLSVPFPTQKALQKEVVTLLENLKEQTRKLESNYQNKLDDLDELKKSILQKAFAGALT